MGNILLFDIDPLSTRFFQALIDDHFSDHRLQVDAPGEHILQACLHGNPLVILIDLYGSGSRGLEMCRQIKQHQLLQYTPLIALSEKLPGKNHDDFILSAGADIALYKPFKQAECQAILKLCLRLGMLENLVPSHTRTIGEQVAKEETRVRKLENILMQTEEALHLERDFSSQVFNAMEQGLVITNTEGHLQYTNPAFSRMTAYQAEDLLGKTPYDVVISDDHHLIDIARTFRKKGHHRTFEIRIQHKNGSTITTTVTVAPFYKAGQNAGSIAFINNITEMKRTEKRLSEIAREYEHIFNGTQAGIFLIRVLGNDTFRFIRNNRAHQKGTGLSLEMIAGKTPLEVLGQEAGEPVRDNYIKCIKQKRSIQYEEESSINGIQKFWHTTLTPIAINKKIEYIVGCCHDITAFKQNEMAKKNPLSPGLPDPAPIPDHL